MTDIEIYRREVPPMSVADLAGELEILSALVDRWTHCRNTEDCRAAFAGVVGRLTPELMKTLVMIAQKQTGNIQEQRRTVNLTGLGLVRLAGAGRRDRLQWVDVLRAEDGTPLLRRARLSPEGLHFHVVTWAGQASIRVASASLWDDERHCWLWDSSACDNAVERLGQKVLPRLPLRIARGEHLRVPDWPRHLEYSSPSGLLAALDQAGDGDLGEPDRREIIKLLEDAGADLNPLWSHLLREGEWG